MEILLATNTPLERCHGDFRNIFFHWINSVIVEYECLGPFSGLSHSLVANSAKTLFLLEMLLTFLILSTKLVIIYLMLVEWEGNDNYIIPLPIVGPFSESRLRNHLRLWAQIYWHAPMCHNWYYSGATGSMRGTILRVMNLFFSIQDMEESQV